MKVDPFLIEHFMNKYEHHVELNLAETCVNPFTLEEFLTLMDREDFFEEFKKKQLTYGYIEGSPELRKGIANQYKTMKEDNILVCGGAIGANFLAFYSLVEPRDNVVSILPAYQQLYSTPRSFGANVKLLKLKWEDQWLPDLKELMKLVDDKTKLIVINNPHNPTGSLIDESLMKRICQIAENAGAYLLCDETYLGLFYEEKDKVPSAVDIYDKAIATGSFSKGISLTGLRLGWIAASKQIIKECMDHRDYTTISNGMIDDALAAIAIKNLDRIYERNIKLLKTNLEILTNWIENEPLIDWIPPSAASVAFLKQNTNISSEKLCVKLINEKSTFLVPGECFEMEGYIRIGFGQKTEALKEGLARFKEFLEQFR